MEPLDLSSLPAGALLLIDTPPIIYMLEEHPRLAARFSPVFAAHQAGRFILAVTTVTIAEVLAGPLRAGDEVLAGLYKTVLHAWRVVDLTANIAETAAGLRASLRLKLADAIQLASAISINAHALVTHDRDFARVSSLRVISWALRISTQTWPSML
ncbi:MAG: type II toxin-antitoxin system VapC family toxin [Caulobacteraceae bacterium]